MLRTHTCNELNTEHIGAHVRGIISERYAELEKELPQK